MAHCENYGTRMSDGLCPNCEEAGFIAETQADFMPDIWSPEFTGKVEADQRARLRRASLKEGDDETRC